MSESKNCKDEIEIVDHSLAAQAHQNPEARLFARLQRDMLLPLHHEMDRREVKPSQMVSAATQAVAAVVVNIVANFAVPGQEACLLEQIVSIITERTEEFLANQLAEQNEAPSGAPGAHGQVGSEPGGGPAQT